MKTRMGCVVAVLGASLWSLAEPALGRTPQSPLVESAVVVLDEIMAIRLKNIPESLFREAEGVAIVPDVIKVGFVAGIRHGRGVLMLKDETGAWTPPQFITLTGGSVGWQAGLQATDVILVFKTRKSIRGLMNGTLTLGVDAAVAAGPVGRNVAAATDAGLQAEVYTYSRSRGLFAGISLDGTALKIDHVANSLYYQPPAAYGAGNVSGQPAPIPPSAVKLMERLARYSGSSQPISAGGVDALGQPTVSAPPDESIRRELAARSTELYAILDEGWKGYLALPAEVFEGTSPPSLAALGQALARFDAVAAEPRYRLLTQRPEFQSTHRLLSQYVATQTPRVGTRLQLPPPPR
ncbi:MAG: lipid-binding SYLF domain-containing protein [Planctomycetota bacterium]